MPMPEAMKKKMFAFTAEITQQIRHINGDPSKSPEEKVKAIEKLKGAPKEDMFEFLNTNFSTGPRLAKSIAKYVSKDRPRGFFSKKAK